MIRILANDGIDAAGKQLLEAAGITVDTNKVAQDQLSEALKNYDGLTVRSATKVRKDLIDACPNLKLIGRGGVGMDNIDVEYARSKGIAVINTPAASSLSVAELVFAHLYGMARFLPQSNRQMPSNGISQFNDLKKAYANGVELKGKTLGILGFGRIGQEVAKIAIGAGMNVLAYDPFVKEVDIRLDFHASLQLAPVNVKISTLTKGEVLSTADFITLHVPMPEDGSAVIGEAELAIMKKGAGIVNCARGGVVDEQALADFIRKGHIAFAAADVFVQEPPVSDTLLSVEQISLTPHIGASTVEAQNRIGIELAEKIISHFKA